MADLPTNYLDDILSDSMGGKRRFKITHLNGASEEVTIEDISKYDQVGSTFGAGDINKINQAVNEKFDSGDVVDPMLTTEPGFAADAYQTKLQFDAQNKNREWKYLGSVGDKRNITLPSEWTELNLIAVGSATFQFNVPRLHIETHTPQSFHHGFYDGSNWYGYCLIKVTKTTAYLEYIKRNGSTEAGTLYVYYK